MSLFGYKKLINLKRKTSIRLGFKQKSISANDQCHFKLYVA